MAEPTRQYFSESEKSTLTELVAKHKDVLENKRNDYKSIKQKSSTWDKLTEEFNSQLGVQKRECKQLKKCWDNLKARAKKILAKEKREVKLTGGGKSTPVDDASSAVAAIIPAQIDRLTNPFDDDNAEAGHDIQSEEESISNVAPTSQMETSAQPSSLSQPSESFTTSSAVSMALSLSKKTPSITPAQTRCLEMQQKQLEAEMEILKLKKEYLVEEHKRKVEVLDAEKQFWECRRSKMEKKQSKD